ncbi:WYL domain-containing protein [Corynebacterium sp. H127]|uniref:helix-turn-helix transcriptional regulator n=1 Tax=Corynebacterium sp. H127 TaxID=3133418 RepID=UPI00309EC92F
MARGSERLGDLVRMLNLLPYFEAHPERSVMEAARDLGRKPGDIMDDLNRLWCCGLPGLMPGDLVDMEADYRSVRIENSRGMNRPLRLTTTEAAALLLALENLESTPGLVNKSAVASAAAKLRDIMGEDVGAVFDATAADSDSDTVSLLRESMDHRRQVRFNYRSASSDDVAQRRVSVAHMFVREGATYATAWDHELGEHRTFRADRMTALQVLDEAATAYAEKIRFNSEDPFDFRSTALVASLEVAADYAWIADYDPVTLGAPSRPGWISATMPVGSEEWLVRFVLASGGKVKIVSPERLRDEVHLRASLALKAYDSQTNV